MVKHHSNKLLILVCLIISAVSVFFILKNSQKSPPTSQKPAYAPRVVVADSPELTTIEAPDGKNKLVAKAEKTKDGTTYSFSVVNDTTGISKNLLTKSVPVGTVISIPFNTFSPDDKYIFLKETTPSNITYFVPLGDQILDISALFPEKHPNYIITDVTGWGGMTLIVVNTDKKEGGVGPSFWFDVTSKSFIQLSTRFN